MKTECLGKTLIIFLIAFLPWSVVASVFGTERLGLDIVRFSKEILIGGVGLLYLFEIIRKKIKIQIDWFDIVVLLFAVWLISISFFQNTPLRGIIYGLRYDVGFLFVIMIMRRALPYWNISLSNILKVFLISGGWMLVVSFLVRYVFGENILTIFGFSDTVSVWDAGGPPPIYHGIAGAAVIRFQGLLEGPNQMAFFLLLYIGSYMTMFGKKKKYIFINILVILFLLFLLLQTYSRSGYLGAILGIMYVCSYSFWNIMRKGNIIKKYKITFGKICTFITIALCIGLVFMLQFGNKIAPIFERHGSTSGHFERMYIGLLRFSENPFGQGLGQAGPASRSIFSVNQDPVQAISNADITLSHVVEKLRTRNPDFVLTTETYYIPESWYIQILIEGGIVGFILFSIIICGLLLYLRKYPYFFAATLGLLLMNLVLHSFESVHTTFVWSILLASILPLSSNMNKDDTIGIIPLVKM